jgi:hypothetical protein
MGQHSDERAAVTAKGSIGMPHIATRDDVGPTTQIDPAQMRSLIQEAARPADPVAIARPIAPSRHLRLVEACIVFAFALALGVTGTLWWLAHHHP